MKRILTASTLIAVVMTTAIACAPTLDSGTSVVVLAYQPQLKRYDRKVVTLSTLEDLVTVQGKVAKVIGNAELNFDSTKVVQKSGNDVKLDVKDVDGALLPADFHSMNILTAYYNIERSALFYDAIGLPLERMGQQNLYYFPEATYGGKEMVDNAVYVSALPGFAVLPYDALQRLPLSINLGVMGHEYTHAVIDTLVTNADPNSPINDPTRTSNEAVNVLALLHEGLADFMATGITCDEGFENCHPDFMNFSVDGEASSSRDLSGRHCLKAQMTVTNSDVKVFTNEGRAYEIGTVLASALWHGLNGVGANEANWTTMTAGILKTIQSDGQLGIAGLVRMEVDSARPAGGAEALNAKNLTLTNALNAIAANMGANPTLQNSVCNYLADGFNLSAKDLAVGCPAGIKAINRCRAKGSSFEVHATRGEAANSSGDDFSADEDIFGGVP